MFWIMKKANTESLRTLVPVHGTHGCAGHLLRSAKGFRAYDSDDREIGGSEGFDSFVGRAVLRILRAAASGIVALTGVGSDRLRVLLNQTEVAAGDRREHRRYLGHRTVTAEQVLQFPDRHSQLKGRGSSKDPQLR
jgi:hypothetical protein